MGWGRLLKVWWYFVASAVEYPGRVSHTPRSATELRKREDLEMRPVKGGKKQKYEERCSVGIVGEKESERKNVEIVEAVGGRRATPEMLKC